MNWESKFSSIVQETEANLAKVKEKLRGKVNTSPITVTSDCNHPYDYSRALPKLSSSVHFPLSSTPNTKLTSDNFRNDTTYFTASPGLGRSSPPNTLQLLNKIDEQTKTIEDLSRTVQILEKERRDNQDQIRQLRNEVCRLSTRVMEHGSNPQLEWQMDQMKRTLMREVQEVRDQLSLFRTRIEKHSAVDHNNSLTVNKGIDEVRQNIQEELEYVKRDLDVLRKRLGSVELGVMSAHYDKKDLERTQDRMNMSLREIVNGRTRSLVDVLRTCPDADQSTNQLQVEGIRSTVQNLKEKLDRVETRLHDTTSPGKSYSGAFRTVSQQKQTVETFDELGGDINSDSDYEDDDLDSDLSVELEDSDIEISSSNKKTTRTKFSNSPQSDISDVDEQFEASSFGSAVLDDDDLDINDLDIDDDIDDDIDV